MNYNFLITYIKKYVFNRISKKIVFSFIFLFSFTILFPSYAEDCDLKDLLKEVNQSFGKRFRDVSTNERAIKMAKYIKENNLDELAYMVEWQLKRDNQRGPWAMKGNTLIHGVYASESDQWMEKVGMKSFGIGIADQKPYAVDGQGSAGLRVRNKFYHYYEIQRGRSLESLSNRVEQLSSGRTEATFFATEEELDAIEKFLDDRLKQEIKARSKITTQNFGTIEKDQAIRPSFDLTSSSLFRESCAGACTSMFSPSWLTHYNAPEALTLATLAVDRGLKNYTSANAIVYSNFRNPNVDAITILGFSRDEMKNSDDFVQKMQWGDVPGMMWGFIPDRPPKNPSPNYSSKRITLSEYVKNN